MFKASDQVDVDGASPAGGAMLSHGQIVAQPLSSPGAVQSAAERRWGRFDVAPDLAEEIGTARWYRGVATVVGLGIAALSFWPDFSVVEAAPALPRGSAVREEYRSQMIMPLRLGGESGRHMGATARMVPIAAVPERATLRLTATLAQGDGLARMLRRAGLSPVDADQAAALIAGAVPAGSVTAGTRFDITLGRRDSATSARSLEKLTFHPRFDLDLTVARQGGALSLERHPLAIDETPLRVRGRVGQSLFLSARAAGAPVRAVEEYLRTLAAHAALDGELAADDEFDMIVSYKRAAGGAGEVGELLYAGLERDGKPRAQLLRWKQGSFVDAAGFGQAQASPAPLAMGMLAPVNGRMTSPYGLRRHPLLGYVRMHAGIDFGASWGAPIHAVSDGVVSFAGRHGGHGNYVRLEHGGGIGTGYGHMSRIAVVPGTRVQAGQVIGYVGSTGLSTGPHLHYELYQNGRTVNPLSVRFVFKAAPLPAAGLDKADLAALKAKIAALKQVKPGAALQKFSPARAMVKASKD